jgi:hypothetical protein
VATGTAWTVLLAAADTSSERPKCPSSRVLHGLGAWAKPGARRQTQEGVAGWPDFAEELHLPRLLHRKRHFTPAGGNIQHAGCLPGGSHRGPHFQHDLPKPGRHDRHQIELCSLDGNGREHKLVVHHHVPGHGPKRHQAEQQTRTRQAHGYSQDRSHTRLDGKDAPNHSNIVCPFRNSVFDLPSAFGIRASDFRAALPILPRTSRPPHPQPCPRHSFLVTPHW